MILSVHQPKILDADYVRGVGLSLDRDKLRVSESVIDVLAKASADGTLVETLKEQDIECVNIYLEKIELELESSDRKADAQELQKEFAMAVVEKMFAIAKLDGEGKTSGLVNSKLEDILGQKLLQQRLMNTANMGNLLTPEQFKRQNDDSASIFFGKLNIEIRKLCEINNSQAVNAIIELIPQLAEPKMLKQKIENDKLFNVKSTDKIFGAA
jgi:hypothetical protein